MEDPRITWVDELDGWVIAYTAFGPGGPGLSLATTHDFRTVRAARAWSRAPEDKNAALLPRRVGGDFILFHRPVTASTHRADVWLSRSADLRSWTAPEPVLGARPGGWWDSARIGIGPPPLETSEGWLVIYHGVRQTVAGALYRVGLALLDLEDPTGSADAATNGCSAPARSTNGSATCPAWSFRAVCCTTPARTSSASTTAQRTPASPWLRPRRPPCSTSCWSTEKPRSTER